MTREEIIEMARQAHLGVTLTHSGEVGQFIEGSNWTEEIEAFAKLVAAKEREACAKICHEASTPQSGETQSDAQWAALMLATSIRARGEA